METNKFSQVVKLENIDRVYSGKLGKCCCGCSGTYKEAEGSKKRMLNKFLKNVQNVQEISSDCYVLDLDNRTYTIYLNNPLIDRSDEA